MEVDGEVYIERLGEREKVREEKEGEMIMERGKRRLMRDEPLMLETV